MTYKILIADDEENIVMSLEFLMEQAGYQVRVAHTGQEALSAIQEWKPDLVLLDVMMPQMSGYDVCQRVRQQPELQATKIVMLTAKGREAEVTKGMALGADTYVTKPFSTKALLADVQRILEDHESPTL